MAAHTWTCPRVRDGEKCAHVNPKRKQICEKCGGRRAPTKKLAHRHVLEVFPYETWVILFSELCGICGDPPKPGKKLMRDHDHRVKPDDPTGGMRGLLCFRCNRQLPTWATIEWMEWGTAYLRRHYGTPDS